MIYCTIAKVRYKCTWAKCLSSAGPYRREILVGVMTQLILNAAASAYHGVIPPVVVDCDNNWVDAPLQSLPINQTQADILHTFKHLVSCQPFCVILKYVQSHTDDAKKWHDCALKERINIKVDRLTKKALKAAHSTRQFMEGTFPYKQIWITMGGMKVTGLLWLELEEFWGRLTTKKFFNKKGIIFSVHFDSVWWVGYNWAISGYPKMFHTFLSLWEENIINKCLQCGYEHENSKHLTRCRDPGWLLQLQNLIKTIMDVLLDDANIASKLANIIKAYLINQGQ
jgi:hypothetical protein